MGISEKVASKQKPKRVKEIGDVDICSKGILEGRNTSTWDLGKHIWNV